MIISGANRSLFVYSSDCCLVICNASVSRTEDVSIQSSEHERLRERKYNNKPEHCLNLLNWIRMFAFVCFLIIKRHLGSLFRKVCLRCQKWCLDSQLTRFWNSHWVCLYSLFITWLFLISRSFSFHLGRCSLSKTKSTHLELFIFFISVYHV